MKAGVDNVSGSVASVARTACGLSKAQSLAEVSDIVAKAPLQRSIPRPPKTGKSRGTVAPAAIDSAAGVDSGSDDSVGTVVPARSRSAMGSTAFDQTPVTSLIMIGAAVGSTPSSKRTLISAASTVSSALAVAAR